MTLLLYASVCGTAFAQVPNISDILKQVPEAPPVAPKPEPPLPDLGLSKGSSAEEEGSSVKIDIKKIKITGNKAIPTKELEKFVTPAEGKSLSLHQLEDIVGGITRYYRSKGYFVAKAYLPAQDVKDGVITVKVVEGTYGRLILKNNSLVDSVIVEDALNDALDKTAVSSEAIERAILVINDMPGALVTRSDIMPGSRAGTSDILINVDPTPRATGYAMVDNYGLSYTGTYRLMAGGDLHSPLGIGDNLSANGLITQGMYIKNYRLAYGLPLGGSGLRGEAAVARTTYELSDAFAALDAVGNANTYDATLSYPFVRSHLLTVQGSVDGGYRDMKDEIGVTSTTTPKRARVITPALTASSEGYFMKVLGHMTGSVSATFGDLSIDDPVARALDAAGPKTQGRYGKVNVSLANTTQVLPRWAISASVKAQKALYGKNLDGSEDMSVSGITGVKAYPSSELANENAYLANAELQYTLPISGPISLRTGVFADAGYASPENKVGPSTARNLSDVGIGFYANYNRLFANVQVATATAGKAVGDSVPQTQVLAQMGTSF